MYNNIIFIMIGLLLWSGTVQAQADKSKILAATKTEALQQIGAAAKVKYDADVALAKQNGWSTLNLTHIDEKGKPVYVTNFNNTAAILTNTSTARAIYSVEGDGFTIGLLEATEPNAGALPLSTHQDFGGRVTNESATGTAAIPSCHATHVAGTLIGSPPTGTSSDSKGMAPKASISAFDVGIEITTMTNLANAGVLISNHSYGTASGYNLEGILNTGLPLFHDYKLWTWHGSGFTNSSDEPNFGLYNGTAFNFDFVTYNAPYYLPVVAAGNDRTDIPSENLLGDDLVRNGPFGTYVEFDAAMHPMSDDQFSSQISTRANAKNILTIGALDKSNVLTDFSSTGLTDDGRLKPDLVGIGKDIYSASDSGTSAYTNKSGTSMATPNVAGSLILLQEYYEDRFGSGNFMRSAALKGLAIHTAADIGLSGPDSNTGWGLLQTSTAMGLISDAAFTSGSSDGQILEDEITASNQQKVYPIYVDGTSDLKATLVWTERPGNFSDAVTNRELRNDLNLKIVRVANSQTYLPLVPNTGGFTGVDATNNVEKIIIANPAAGTYNIIVEHNSSTTGVLYQAEPQVFALVYSGLDDTCHETINHSAIDIPSADYNAKDLIESTTEIKSGITVNYKAGNRVALKPGFKAVSGCTFNAVTDVICN